VNNGTAPASLKRRLAALVYDSFLLTAVLFIAALPPTFINGEAIVADGSIKHLAFILYLLLIWFVFYGWFWTHGGQTLGMSAWRIRVITRDGQSISWRNALIRWLTAVLGIANFSILLIPGRCGWHEKLSGTRTVRLKGNTR
jgi:uncharacterized RDD family membrane protein YckC